MRKLKKILALVLIIILMMQVMVFAENTELVIDSTRKGSITINVLQDRDGSVVTSDGTGETQTIPTGATALENVKFELYKVEDECEDLTKPETTALETQVTDENGQAEFTDLELGRYLVVPTEYPSNVKVEIANFLVDVPMMNTAQTAWNYDVVVYPKVQTVYGTVVLTNIDENHTKLTGANFELLKKNDEGTYVKYTNLEYINVEAYTTNSNGQICIENLPKGEYQLVETVAPNGFGLNKTPIEFEITETSTKTESENDVWTASKDELNLIMINYKTPDSDNFEFNKKLGDGVSGGANIDATHTWTITSSIPGDIENYTRFLVTDNISEKLILDEDSITITADGEELQKDTDYTVYYTNKLLKIAFIDAGITGDNLSGKSTLEITYTTTFDKTNIVMGEAVQNSASIYWDTNYDEDGPDDGEDPTDPTDPDDKKKEDVDEPADVHTGGLKIKKVDTAGNELSGAIFKIATSEENAKAGIFVKIDGVEVTAISGEDGLAFFEGLAYGTAEQDKDNQSTNYWLVETVAPSGYNLLSTPVEVTIDKDSYTTDNPIEIQNRKGILLPLTGGIGTIIFIVIGVALMSIAIIIFIKRDKKEDEEEKVDKKS